MPVIKNALLRYRVIDRCIRNDFQPFPSKEKLRQTCEEELYGSVTGQNICHSTIEKDIFAMRNEHDAPIAYSKLERGYFYEDKNFSMDDIPLTDSDISAIKAATNILNQFKNTQLFGQFQYAIDKILDRVEMSANKKNYHDDIVHFESQPTVGGNEFLAPILAAIKERKSIQFNYQSFRSETGSVRRLQPYLLKEYRNRWYLIGKSELKEEIRTFALDRMEGLIELESPFTIDSNFSAEVFFQYSIGITTYDGQPEKVIIEAEKVLSKYLLSQPLHHTQKLNTVKNGKHTFSYQLLPSYELKMLLLGFGKELRVISPNSLVKDIQSEAKGILSLYA
jgi:predicted DNA-binding transcriptional regulator YafY